LEAEASVAGHVASSDEVLRQRAVQLSVAIFAVALAMTFANERLQFGINLFTAELLFCAVVTTQLLRTIRRLVASS
jgi:hypothetical protein